MITILLVLILCALLFGSRITLFFVSFLGIGLITLLLIIGAIFGIVFFAIKDIEGLLGIMLVILLLFPSIYNKLMNKIKMKRKSIS